MKPDRLHLHIARGLPVAVALLAVAFLWVPGGPSRAADGDKAEAAEASAKPLRALMLTGGCCHDYEQQKFILSNGISERARVEWKIVHEGGSGTKHQFELLRSDGWQKDFDVVLYNICFAHEPDREYIDGITAVHAAGLPAVALHCTMHTYHWKTETDSWEQMLGVTSPRHGKHAPITVKNVKADHPVMKGFGDQWVTPQGELYHIKEVWPTATVLAEGTIDDWKSRHACIWVNEFGEGKTRVFGTTIGHHNETMSEDTYLDVVTRGLLWAAGKLNDDGSPAAGFAAAAP